MMDNNQRLIEQIGQQGIVPLFYHADPVVCIAVVDALYEAGIRLVEYTNRGGAALENFDLLVKHRAASLPGLILAAGTIRSAEDARNFIHAGADVLISPVFDPDVADISYINKVLWIPGCMTPTEVHQAEGAGCRLVKLFPGSVLRPHFIAAVKELFPGMRFMPTGGIDLSMESFNEWFNAGAFALGMGSKLISAAVLDTHNYPAITSETRKAMALVDQYRS